MSLSQIVLALATLTAALMAGLFYAYSCSVSPGLARVPDAAFLSSFQAINRAIQNPVFFAAFFGILVLTPWAAYLQFGRPVPSSFILIVSAFAVYVIGVFGVTAFGNIPLNNALDGFNITNASAGELAAQRARFEARWNYLNTVRTIASTLTALLMIIACIKQGKA
jgi:uncharacterized membrane protein